MKSKLISILLVILLTSGCATLSKESYKTQQEAENAKTTVQLTGAAMGVAFGAYLYSTDMGKPIIYPLSAAIGVYGFTNLISTGLFDEKDPELLAIRIGAATGILTGIGFAIDQQIKTGSSTLGSNIIFGMLSGAGLGSIIGKCWDMITGYKPGETSNQSSAEPAK